LAATPTAFYGIVTRGDATSLDAYGYGAGYFARTFTYVIYKDFPDISHPLQRFTALASGGVQITPK
ncbi:MAG: hypothetical protein JWO08_2703, partial [Verrucomicrobiaceae bacterium]|nr:hypothetical protein [Verrucomicrobiaceae bacterium]